MRDYRLITMQARDRGFLVVDGKIVELEFVNWYHDDHGNIYYSYKYVEGGYIHSSYNSLFKTKEECREDAIAKLG